jgi:hypothetical protein
MIMAKNTHKVPKKQWAKWSKQEQAVFNRLWCRLCPGVLPPAAKMTQRQFNILRWNVCWTAADMMREWR